jgi:hypothetical protein
VALGSAQNNCWEPLPDTLVLHGELLLSTNFLLARLFRVNESSSTGWVVYVARMGVKNNAYIVWLVDVCVKETFPSATAGREFRRADRCHNWNTEPWKSLAER